MAEIENLTATSELGAVNTMLASIGEAPLSALGSGHPQEELALDILTEVAKTIQSRRWRFNSEYSYTISSEGDDSNGFPVFAVPSGLASWRLSLVEVQRGLDIVARKEREAVVGSDAWIFADRVNGTDGIGDLADEDELLINPVWFVDFEQSPQSFRSYATVVAARRLAQTIGANQESSYGFTEEDERLAASLFQEDQKEVIPVPPLGSAGATELEALNQILTAGGAAPAVSLAGIWSDDHVLALQTLRDTSREIQSQGWKFNLEHGFELEPDDTYDWVDSAGVTTTLNLWFPPSDMLAFEVTPTLNQLGVTPVDIVVKLSTRYTPQAQVFYDRYANRDGLDADDYDFLYLDITRYIAWSELPETAKQYIMVLAARRFASMREGSDPRLLPWAEQDVRMARRALRKDQGPKRRRNTLDDGNTWEHRGRRNPTFYRDSRGFTRR